MEGLFAVIFIIIGIANFIMKQQQQEQKQSRGGTKGQQPVYKTQPPRKTVMEMKDFWEEGLKGVMESEAVGEGLEAEDRSRTGSLNYVEQSQSLEGTCDEHPEHRQKKKKEKEKEKKAVPSTEVVEAEEEGIAIELTEEHLLSSFIMAEIIGPPRSLKRSIR